MQALWSPGRKEMIDIDFIMMFMWYVPLALGIAIGYVICILTMCFAVLILAILRRRPQKKGRKK